MFDSLLSFDYKHSQSNFSFFTKQIGSHFTSLLIYVDDIVFFGNDNIETQRVKTFLDQRFKIENLGSLNYFLGLEIERSDQGFFLKQWKYTLDLLEYNRYLAAKPATTLYDMSLKPSTIDSPLYEDATQFRRF